MKKMISLIVTFAMLLTVAGVGIIPSYAEDSVAIPGTDISYRINNKSKTLEFTGAGVIPDYNLSYNEDGNFDKEHTYPWYGMAYTSIDFSEGITGIGNYAFSNSANLESVTIPDTITSIGKGAFRGCENLQSVNISDEVTVINELTFDGCFGLKNVVFPDKLTEIKEKAFYNCNNEDFTSIELPSALVSIGEYAFSACGLESLICPENLETIGKNAFSACSSLKEIKFNDKLTSIGVNAFKSTGIEKIEFPESLTAISNQVCGECKNLRQVILPNSIVKIDTRAFYKCPELKEIEIPFSVVIIGDKALGYTSTSAKVENFKIKGYDDETAAKTYADENEFTYESLGKAYEGTCGESVSWSFNKENGVLAISGTGAMENYTAETPAVYNKFAKLTKSIVIGDEITAVGDYAFFGFNDATFSLTDCKALSAIGKKAFYNMSTSVFIPSGVTSIGESGIGKFDETGKADESFTITGENFSYAKKYALENGFNFIVEDGSVPNEGACGEKATWKYDKEDCSLTISGEGAMNDYSSDKLPEYVYHVISKINIEPGITSIGAYAFFGADAVNEIYLNPSITSIGEKSIGYKFDLENEAVKIDGMKIHGYNKTEAEKYASDNEFEFVSKGDYIGVSGTLGETAQWKYDERTKALTVYGTGETTTFTKESLPVFANYNIEKIVIEEGITKIGDCGLLGINSVKEITVAYSVEAFGENSLGYTVNEENEIIKLDGIVFKVYDSSFAEVYAKEKEFTVESLGKFGVYTGKCGETVEWTFDSETSSLELSGTGETFDYTLDSLPDFSEYEIEEITVENGITSLGNNIFVLTKGGYDRVVCSDTITKIGENAIGFTRGVEEIEESSKFITNNMTDVVIEGFLVTPVYRYAKTNNIKFVALDEDRIDFDFTSLPVRIDHNSKNVFVYSEELDAEKVTEDCSVAVKSFTFKTGEKLILTADEKDYEYTVIIVADVNMDNKIDSTDALNILMYTVGSSQIEGNSALCADVNNDGKINSTDALNILQITVELLKLEDLNK